MYTVNLCNIITPGHVMYSFDLMSHFLLAEPWFIVMVKASQGDVLSYLKTSQNSGASLPHDELLIILHGIIAGLDYLHSIKVCMVCVYVVVCGCKCVWGCVCQLYE